MPWPGPCMRFGLVWAGARFGRGAEAARLGPFVAPGQQRLAGGRELLPAAANSFSGIKESQASLSIAKKCGPIVTWQRYRRAIWAINDSSSKTRLAARIAVICCGSNGGATSTRSAPTRFRPDKPRRSCSI